MRTSILRPAVSEINKSGLYKGTCTSTEESQKKKKKKTERLKVGTKHKRTILSGDGF